MTAAPVRVLGSLAAVLLVGAGLAACGGDDESGADGSGDSGGDGLSAGATAGTGGDSPALGDIELTLTPVASADSPTAVVSRASSETLYVAERAGAVRAVTVTGEGADRRYELADDPVVDISDQVVEASGPGDERGLLDITFSPDGATLYVSYSLNPSGDTRVAAYTMAGEAADPDSAREILAVPQPYRNHNGGDIEFGPDGYLYVALGDGGGGGDPEGNGQDTEALLGKILRIDPSTPSGGNEYGIPADNPFADGGGAPEVWLYGVRNPWRLTFHPDSGDLWVADVGQQSWEEIDVLPASDGGGAGAGANLGWNEMEGTHPYEGGSPPDGAVEPIFEYGHDEGCSITGGVIYTGTAVAGLAGAYLFADYCTGQLRAVRGDADGATDGHVWEDAAVSQPVSFGVDARGDAYVVSLEGDILRIDPAG